jgi:hypothetical protein
MKLQYEVLWFDDSEDLLDSINWDYLSEQITEWGFIPRFTTVTTSTDFIAQSPFYKYDLIVVDFNLGEDGHGQDFIKKVREQEVFTEIIFYSSGSTTQLWDAVRSNELEGVYVANKSAISERILKVGKQTLRKVLDLENMRGIVMAEVGDLDLQLDAILSISMGTLEPHMRQDVFNRFHAAVDEQHTGHKASLDQFKLTPTIELLLSLCDSNKRWQNYRRVTKHHPLLANTLLGDYVSEILQPRNFLGHGIPVYANDGLCTFKYQGKEYQFNDAESKALRLKIIEYKTRFAELQQALAA